MMYLVCEENHSNLCVTESYGNGIMWLIMNKWLDGGTIGVDEWGVEFEVREIVKGCDEIPFLILSYLIELQSKEGLDAVASWLENFGFYFVEIEVA